MSTTSAPTASPRRFWRGKPPPEPAVLPFEGERHDRRQEDRAISTSGNARIKAATRSSATTATRTAAPAAKIAAAAEGTDKKSSPAFAGEGDHPKGGGGVLCEGLGRFP